jgi:hypothetical protein
MTYAAASNVAEYCPGLLDDGRFTTTTRPTEAAVTRFLSAGYAIINARLNAAKYTTPVDSSAAIYDQVVDLESLYGAARAESVRMTARVAVTERTRAQYFMDQFEKGLERLATMNLSDSGITRTSRMYAGGISVSDKTSVSGDGDRVEPRFERGQWRHSGTSRPSAAVTDDESA